MQVLILIFDFSPSPNAQPQVGVQGHKPVLIDLEDCQLSQSSDGIGQSFEQVLGEMEVRDRLKSGDVLRENLQLVLGDVEAGQLPQLVDLHGQPGQLVVVKPEFCKKKIKSKLDPN